MTSTSATEDITLTADKLGGCKRLVLICNTQNRSKVILAKLKNQGYQNIQYVDGGMIEWAAKGWPMVKP